MSASGARPTRGRRTQPPEPAPRLEDCHELARERALELAGGDRRRCEPVTATIIRVVNPS